MQGFDMLVVFLLLLSMSSTDAFVAVRQQQQQPQELNNYVHPTNPKKMTTSLFGRRRGKGSSSSSASSDTRTSTTSNNWVELPAETSLPQEDNAVKFLDTWLPALKNISTNPTGAIACVKVVPTNMNSNKNKNLYYAFDCNCPTCKVPLNKATIQENGLLTCDFCKTSYDLKDNGKKTESDLQNVGLLGKMANSFFSKQVSGPLKMFKLGEKDGKLLISLDTF